MVYSILRRAQRDLRSRRSGFPLILLVFTLLMILLKHTTTWKVTGPPSLREYSFESRVFSECRKFSIKERRNLDNLYYIQDRKKNRSLIWCKVPKAGSTTLVRMFLRLAGASNADVSRGRHNRFYALYPRPTPEELAWRLNTTFKLMVVRHPFERILSAYRDKFEIDDIKGEMVKHAKAMVRRRAPNGAFLRPTFLEFVTYLLETNPETDNEHWMPISRLCSPCNIQYDAIVRMENFSMEIKGSLRQIGIYEDSGWENSSGTSRTTIERYFQQLSFSQLLKLYEIYQEDFLLFGYKPNEFFSIVARKNLKKNSTLAPTLQPGA